MPILLVRNDYLELMNEELEFILLNRNSIHSDTFPILKIATAASIIVTSHSGWSLARSVLLT